MVSWLSAFLKWIILVPVILLVLLLGIANDQPVTIRLNPFDPADPALSFELLFYQVAFLLFVVGALLGAFVSWSSQRKYRRRAWQHGQEAKLWRYRAKKAEDNQAPATPVAPMLASPERR